MTEPPGIGDIAPLSPEEVETDRASASEPGYFGAPFVERLFATIAVRDEEIARLRERTIRECAAFVGSSDPQKPLDCIAKNLIEIFGGYES